MRWLPLVFLAVPVSACQSQSSLDAAALRAAAAECGVKDLHFERVVNEKDRQAEKSSSPFRQFGRWWVENHARSNGVTPIYQVNVAASCGGFSDEAARVRQLHNRQFDCLAKATRVSKIELRPTCAVILE
jgi:hypothetical protein